MNEEFKTKEIVSELVPHKGKMFLLNRVQSYSLETISITTEIDITRDDGTKYICFVWNLWPLPRRKAEGGVHYERQ